MLRGITVLLISRHCLMLLQEQSGWASHTHGLMSCRVGMCATIALEAQPSRFKSQEDITLSEETKTTALDRLKSSVLQGATVHTALPFSVHREDTVALRG